MAASLYFTVFQCTDPRELWYKYFSKTDDDALCENMYYMLKAALSFFKLQITKSGQPSKTKSDWFLQSLWQSVELFICWCFVMANIGSICTKWKWLLSVLPFCSNCQIHPIWLLMASLSLPTGNAASLNYSAKALTRFPDLLVILS